MICEQPITRKQVDKMIVNCHCPSRYITVKTTEWIYIVW